MPQSQVRSRQQPPFDLIAGNLSLDFINTLDDRPTEPRELLTDYADLARFAEQTAILTREQADDFYKRARRKPRDARQGLTQARHLREALHAIFVALLNQRTAPQPAMDTLNATLHDAAFHSRLRQIQARCQWRFDDPATSFNAILWPIARAAAYLLTSPDLELVRACSSPTCQWFFLDTSKNHHRRWCSMKLCGNRTKVRKFYAKKKTA